ERLRDDESLDLEGCLDAARGERVDYVLTGAERGEAVLGQGLFDSLDSGFEIGRLETPEGGTRSRPHRTAPCRPFLQGSSRSPGACYAHGSSKDVCGLRSSAIPARS